MAGAASELDSELLEELQFVERVRALFKAAGVALAFWEAYCLSQSNRARLNLELDRSSAAAGAPDIPTEILESLRLLRTRGGPIVRKLTQFLSVPRSAEDSDRQELALAVLLGSNKGREAVGRWVNEPARYAQEASERIRVVISRLEGIRQALRPAEVSETPAAAPAVELPPPPPPPPPQPQAPPPPEIMMAPPGISGELVVLATPGRVALAWNPVEGATGYTVKRSEAPGAPFVTIATPSGCAYADESVSPGATYRYAVSASSIAGEGADSAPAQVTTPPPMAAPAGLVAVAGDGRVSLKWNAVPDATAYHVKRGAPTGPRARLITVPGCAYVDEGVTNGASYGYSVSAAGPSGESRDSAVASANPVAPPPAPVELNVSTGNARLLINWPPVPGAKAYNVKRATAAGGPYETIAAGIEKTAQGDAPPMRGTKYFYVVSAIGPGGEGPDSEPVVKALPVPPPAPMGLTATPGNGRISLAWVASPGAARYNVKRKAAPGAKYAVIASPTAAAHVDAAVANGASVEYVVSAVSGAGEGPDSLPVRAEPLGPPPAPAGFTAEAGKGKVLLSWRPAAGAAEYRIQRSMGKEGFFAEIARIEGATSYADENVANGTTYDYVVVAVNAGGNSPASARARATPMSAPAAPRGLQGSAGQGRVLLTWAASSGASKYSVKRATSADGPFVAIAVTGETTHTDVSVLDGTTYYYRVSAVNAGGESEDAGPLAATPVERPAPPAGLAGVPGDRQIALSWQASAGAASYVVKRATAPGGPFTTIGEAPAPSHVDREVDSRMTYYYTVAAVNAAGRSAPSDVVSATPRPPA